MVTIKVNNWEEHNPKKDQKTYTWFRMENTILTNQKLFKLNHAQKWAFIGILGEASKKNKDTVDIDIEWLSHEARCPVEQIEEMFRHLQSNGVLTVATESDRTRPNPVVNGRAATESALYERDERTNDTISCVREAPAARETPPNPAASFENSRKFDLPALFALYPRHEQKGHALKLLAATVKTAADYDRVKHAITRYAKHCETTPLEYKFRKKFANWWEEWEDWLDPKTGVVGAVPQTSPARVDPPAVWESQKAAIAQAGAENKGKTLDYEGCANFDEWLRKKAQEVPRVGA